MDREQFFRELCTVLGREGFTTQPEQDDLLPVEWDGSPLCRITEGGGVRYWQEDVATSERDQACERATNLACMVQEYMTLMEQAPPLKAQGLSGDFKVYQHERSEKMRNKTIAEFLEHHKQFSHFRPASPEEAGLFYSEPDQALDEALGK